MEAKVNIFFDEKGPTKTIKVKEEPTSKEKFNYQLSDDIPAYSGIYIMIDNDKQEIFDQRYKQIETKFRDDNPQISEIKGKNIFKKITTLQDISPRAEGFLTDLLKLLKEVDAHVQLSAFDKSAVIVSARLVPWLFDLEINSKLSKYSPLPIHSFLYTIVKYVRTEDQNKEFLSALNNENLSTYQILKVLKGGLRKFIDKHEIIPRTAEQCKAYKELIKIINISHKDTTPAGKDFKFPVHHLPYGLNLFILNANLEPENCIIYLDDDAPTDGYNSQDFHQVNGGLDSRESPGLRAADILAVLLGNLLANFDRNMNYDHSHPETRTFLPSTYFRTMSDEKMKIADDLNQLIFSSTNKFAVVHSEFADYVFALTAWFKLVTANDDTSFNDKEHLKLTLELMQQNFDEMMLLPLHLNRLGYKTFKAAIDDGQLKPLI